MTQTTLFDRPRPDVDDPDLEEKQLLTDAEATAIEITGDMEEGLCR